MSRPPRIGFVLEQALGHVAYGMSLRRVLERRTDLTPVWLEVKFDTSGFGRVPVVGRSYFLRGNARARHAIARAHRAAPLDALFVHTSMIGLLSGDYFARIPTLLSLDATPLNYDELATSYAHAVGSPAVERAKLLVHRTVMRRARALTAWSAWTKNSLVKDYGLDAGRISVIHPGTMLTNFPDTKSGERRSGPMRVLFVGGDFERKGGDLLLDVFRRRLRGSTELHLVTGATLPPEEGVHVYNGVKPHSSVLLQLYADADVFVLPTRGDCLAVVLGEAMASRLPIITTRVGAHAEAVREGESGFVIDSGDAEALGDRLARLAASPDLRARMGRRSRQVGEDLFDMQKNANLIGDALIEIADARREPAHKSG